MTKNSKDAEIITLKSVLVSIGVFLTTYLAVALLHGARSDLPFWGDSIGYVIFTAKWFAENNTIINPVWHDPGHPPLCFLVLLSFWKIFGTTEPWVSHLCQWFWVTWIWLGAFQLSRSLFPGNRLAPFGSVLLFALHPHLFMVANTLDLEAAQLAAFLWLLVGFYQSRPLVYITSASILLLTKLSSIPLLFFFCSLEFVLIPVLLSVRYRWKKLAVESICLNTSKWILYTILASVPLLVWLIYHYHQTGYWFQSENFSHTTSFVLEQEFFLFGFFERGAWNVYFKEGNELLIKMSFAISVGLMVMLFINWKQSIKLFPFQRLSLPSHRSFFQLFVSFFFQGLLIYTMYSLKYELLHRYLLPVQALLILCFLVLLGTFLQNVLHAADVKWSHKKTRLVCTVVLFPISGILAFNYFVRLHAETPDRIGIPSAGMREWFRNEQLAGSDQNLQLVTMIEEYERMVHWLERREEKEGKAFRVYAQYPITGMLELKEAGYLEGEPLEVRLLENPSDLFESDWDYYATSPATESYDRFLTSEVQLEYRIYLKRQFIPETWRYEEHRIRLYRNGRTEEPAP